LIVCRDGQKRDRRQITESRKLGRLSLARAKVALVAINIISALVIIKLHNEASSRNLSSNLELENHVDNIHLPPTHKGQEINKLEKSAVTNNNSNNIDANHTHPVCETHLKEFPYPLTCKESELYNFLERNKLIDLKTGARQEQFNGAISLHVGMVNNWKLILEDQITTLKECGLLGIAATPLMISYSNGLLSDLFQVLNPLLGSDGANNTISTVAVESTGVPWEGPAMNMIHRYCNEQAHLQTTVVHNKGASKWHSSWREQISANKTWTYGHSLYDTGENIWNIF